MLEHALMCLDKYMHVLVMLQWGHVQSDLTQLV